MPVKKTRSFFFTLLSFALLSCNQEMLYPTPTKTLFSETFAPLALTETSTKILPSETFAPSSTQTLSIPDTSETQSPIAQTEISSTSNETLIYDDGANILAINAQTGESRVLISRSELQILFGKDRSAQSSTYGKETPFQITLSPNLKEALVSACFTLDNKFRCSDEYFVYSLEEKTAIRLDKPGAYGVYWTWSPDGLKLAGSAWLYSDADYELTRFYAINHNGTNLVALSAVGDNDWRINWHPGNEVILPLTTIANFRSIFIDGSREPNILVSGLAQTDKALCLSFSPDFNRVAFSVRQAANTNVNQIYVARSDFAEVSLIAEYPANVQTLCDIQWSPNQRFIYLNEFADTRVEVSVKQNNFSKKSMLLNLETSAVADISQNAFSCGWTPDNQLIYEEENESSEAVRVRSFDPTTLQSDSLPENLDSLIQHCPLQWLENAPSLNIPNGFPVRNACYPGKEIADEEEAELSPLFDILSVSSSLDDKTLSVTFHSAAASKNLNDYLTPNIPETYLNGWEVLIDADNNFLSGDKLGIDYRFSVGVKPRPDGNPPGLMGVILKFDTAQNTYIPISALQMSFDPDAATLQLTGEIPEITNISRLVFLSRIVKAMNGSSPNVNGDRLCN